MKQSFHTRISINTNANKELHTVQAPTNDDDFQKLFRVSHRRCNEAKKIQSQSWIILRISTDTTLATIRKEQTVHDALQRSHGNLVYYPWTEDVHDVVPLGFFAGPLPKYMTSTQFEEERRTHPCYHGQSKNRCQTHPETPLCEHGFFPSHSGVSGCV
ncbi:hypothetical protein IV203_012512 [Nitzschia inconspicua]|uniref:Uncharacterized protein n=1 Tax=Nitzschia inconspicua TaxID=303405 RepID=A0A9K3PJT8_9STRA|nr:hypothetical protein IV203_012722 [Nitzschia inconspicua]KAG7349915.1 hypothetical protein IV203_012512 [Nitzschia inconspicua]